MLKTYYINVPYQRERLHEFLPRSLLVGDVLRDYYDDLRLSDDAMCENDANRARDDRYHALHPGHRQSLLSEKIFGRNG